MQLFSRSGSSCHPIEPWLAPLEGDLQHLFESNLQTLLGVALIAREFDTGSGRMDTLAIDADRCPVIIEYKRSEKSNIINQALCYQAWLVSHKAEFEKQCFQKYGIAPEHVDWSGLRLICIAADFNSYDISAIEHIKANIDLVSYRLYGQHLVSLTLLRSSRLPGYRATGRKREKKDEASFEAILAYAPPSIADLARRLIKHIDTGHLPVSRLTVGSEVIINHIDKIGRVRFTKGQIPRLRCEILCSPEEIFEHLNEPHQAGLSSYRRTRNGFDVSIFDEQSLLTVFSLLEALCTLKERASAWN